MAKAEYTIALRDELHDAARKALRTLTTIMDKPDAPDSVRLKAALAILTRPQSIEQSWTLPQPVHHGAVRQAEAKLAAAAETDLNTSEHFSPVSEPELEDDLDIDDTELDEDLVNAEIDELLNEYIQAKQNSKPQPEVDLEIDALLNKSEQEKQNSKPQPVHVEKIGRNEVCPCGSGIKYKRCCLGKSQSAYAA
ncbi:MAG: SEC-C domain-containing protein [Acidobacteria bacterium]|nr:SEC-C domain-containing protein [Acidobacteriota bacterium]